MEQPDRAKVTVEKTRQILVRLGKYLGSVGSDHRAEMEVIKKGNRCWCTGDQKEERACLIKRPGHACEGKTKKEHDKKGKTSTEMRLHWSRGKK